MIIPKKLYATLINTQDALVDLRDDSKNRITSAMNYISKNRNTLLLGLSLAASVLRASQSLVVTHRNYSNRKYSERSYYDNRTHTRWNLRRKLTNYEKKKLNERISNGESAFDILDDFGVLK